MTTYKTLGGEVFTADNDADFLDFYRKRNFLPVKDDIRMMKRIASTTDATRGFCRFSSIPEFRTDLIRLGYLEVVDA